MRHSRILLATLTACALMSSANAGDVITANLPSGDVIVAIDGRADGAGAVNESKWYQPFNVNGQLLEYTFQPGTYAFRDINATDAAAMFPGLTASQLAQIGAGAWTFNAPWVTGVIVFDGSAASDPSESQLLNIAGGSQSFSDPDSAYAAAVAGGYYDQIVVGDPSTGPVQSSFTLTRTTTLIFVVPDYLLGDNNGVESVLVTSFATVPEPSSCVLAMLGLGTIAARLLARGMKRGLTREGETSGTRTRRRGAREGE